MRLARSRWSRSKSARMTPLGPVLLGTNAGAVRNRRRTGGSSDQARSDPSKPHRYGRLSAKPGRPVATATSIPGRTAAVVRFKCAMHSAADHPPRGGRAWNVASSKAAANCLACAVAASSWLTSAASCGCIGRDCAWLLTDRA